MDHTAVCCCGHADSEHRMRRVGKTLRDMCAVRGCDCTDFCPLDPPDAATEVGTEESRTNEAAGSVDAAERDLILAWDSWWCPTCSARTFVADARCCGQRMVPVRIEMYERDGG